MKDTEVDVAIFDEGDARYMELNAALERTWQRLKEDPNEIERIASMLGIPAADLQKHTVPMTFKVRKAGLTGAEIALVAGTWLVTEVMLGAAKDLLKDILKAKAKQLWKEVLEPALRRELPDRGALGSRKASEEDS